MAEQWGERPRRVDFYDVKADIEALFWPAAVEFEAASHPALHPGKSAQIRLDSKHRRLSWRASSSWRQKFGLPESTVLFELDLDSLWREPANSCRDFEIPVDTAGYRRGSAGKCSRSGNAGQYAG